MSTTVIKSPFAIQDLGGFSRFQILVLLLGTVMCVSAASNHLSPLFTAFSPPFNCLNSDHNNTNNNSEVMFDSKCPDVKGMQNLECDFDSTIMSHSVITDFMLICEREGLKPIITSSYMSGVCDSVLIIVCLLYLYSTIILCISR